MAEDFDGDDPTNVDKDSTDFDTDSDTTGESDGAFLLASQGSVTFTGKMIGNALGLIFLSMATRLTSKTVFGVYTLGLTVVLFTKELADFSLDQSIDYFIPQHLENGRTAVARYLVYKISAFSLLGVVVAAVCLVVGRGSIATLLDESTLKIALPLFVLIMIAESGLTLSAAVFRSVKRMELRVISRNISFSLLRIILIGGLLIAGWDLFGLVVGHLLAILLTLFITLVLLYRYVDWFQIRSALSAPTDKMESTRSILAYSLPLAFTGSLQAITGYIDYFFIGYFQPSSKVATYKIGFALATTLLMFRSSLIPVLKPMIVEVKDDTKKLRERYALATRWALLTTLPAATTMILAPEPFLAILFSPSYLGASLVVIVLTGGIVMRVIVGPTNVILEGSGLTRVLFVNMIAILGVNFLIDVLLVPELGIVGAAVGTAAGLAIGGVLGLVEIYAFKGVHPFSWSLVPAGLSIVPTALGIDLAARALDSFPKMVVVLPLLALAIYYSTFYLMGGVTDHDRDVINTFFNRVPELLQCD
ncbi:oligosaccharide flippase family protein [Halomicrobium sp. IBSBa]|uniref:oligosaccharide flippase family protein n=1 Tax=Halomicrobium sp. IBSBa TaxID=2778916 RepID=UPI001ABFBEA3|nr:oligosaccharide flippase family protein [Halomicrobium sp. IBSBa]MBO4247092.1 oligosaccharide flippase family protein [Halomicrobium sp. IBSBa]